jgi:hypothetical protein
VAAAAVVVMVVVVVVLLKKFKNSLLRKCALGMYLSPVSVTN